MPDPTLEEWAEKAGIENLRGRLATGDFLTVQASTLLSLLLVGIGGGLAYAVKLAETAATTPFVWGMVASTLWLCLVAAILMAKCIKTRDTPALFNEPLNLCPPGTTLSLPEVRRHELENISARIKQATERNAGVAAWLDKCRNAAIVTPLVFGLAAAIAAVVAACR